MSEELLDISRSIRFDSIRYFLTAKQWAETDSKYRNLSVFTRQDEYGDLKIKVPRLNTNEALYSAAMADAIRVLADLNEQDPIGLATSLQREVLDLHRLHLPASIRNPAGASLPIISTSTTAFSKLLHDSMLEEADDSPKAAAEKFRGECTFGHTFKGCFGISIEAPTNSPLNLFGDQPTSLTAERRANNRIAHGLNALAKAVKDGSHQLFRDSMSDGLTSSMCKTFLELAPVIHAGEFEYEPIWSPFLPQETDFKRVKLNKISLDYLELEASPASTEPQEIPVKFIGAVEKMQASIQNLRTASAESKVFKFGVRGNSEETGSTMLTFAVDRSTYERALTAHGSKVDVLVSCKVKKRTRGWYVTEFNSLYEAPPTLPT